jgi:hypothetical protein
MKKYETKNMGPICKGKKDFSIDRLIVKGAGI